MAQLAGGLSGGAAVLISIGAAIAWDPTTLTRVTGPLIMCGMGFYQLWTARYRPGLLLMSAAVITIVQVAILGSGSYIQAAAIGLVLIGMVWTLFLDRPRWWHLAGYSILLVSAQIAWERDMPLGGLIGSAVGTVAAYLGAVTMVRWLQKGIRASQARYRDLFEASPVALWEEDFSEAAAQLERLRTEGVTNIREYLESNPHAVNRLVRSISVVDINAATLRLVGADERGEVLGYLQAPHNRSSRASYIAQLEALWLGQAELDYEFRGQMRTGENRDFNIKWTVREPAYPGQVSVIVAMTDFTVRKTAERALKESRDQFERLAVNAADAITRLRLQPEPHWDYVSPAVERIVGYSPDEFYADGYIMRRITHPDHRHRLGEYMNEPETWDEAITVRLIAKSGREVWAEMRLTPIYDHGELAYIETITRDITERKEYQTRLEELIRSKDEFVASVSHELRTPMTAVVGLAQELRDNLGDFSPEEVNELIELIASQSTEVADIVDDLLVSARADIGKVSIYRERLDLASEVQSVVGALAASERRKVTVLGDSALCMADSTRVRQIVRNLLTNAFRYGGDRVEIETAARNGHGLVVVRDNGAGIPPEDIELIFDPYHRAHSDRNQPGSVGLGLTVSRQLADLMRGSVTYRHEKGQSVFELSLPGVKQSDGKRPASLIA